jgi:hypothetical protein
MADTAELFLRILHKLESDEEITGFREPRSKLLLWPFVRHRLLFHLMFTQRNFTEVGQGNISTTRDWLKTCVFMLTNNPVFLLFRTRKILIFSGGISNIKKDGRYMNRLGDYFFQVSPQNTALLEDPLFNTYALPRAHNKVYANLFLRLLALIYGRVFGINKRELKETLHKFFALIESKLQGESFDAQFMDNLKLSMQSRVQRIASEYKLYKMFFRLAKPVLILMEDAAYGSKAHIIKAAHDLGIEVGEYQHGFINATHLAYNYGSAVNSDSTYSQYLPDYYLSYGKYWSDSINIPISKMDIGNPHLSESIAKLNGKPLSNRMLVLGGGADPEPLIELILLLAGRFGDRYDIVFRPHPLEWPKVSTTYSRLIEKKVKIDVSSDMYLSILEASVIIGELSTAIFEAKAFDKKVYIIPNTYSKSFGLETLKFFPTLEEGIQNEFQTRTVQGGDADLLWRSHWRENYESFLKSVIDRHP